MSSEPQFCTKNVFYLAFTEQDSSDNRKLNDVIFYVHVTITIHFYSDHGEVKASGKEGEGNFGEAYLYEYLFIVHLIFL